ncbi:hypothetical protein CU097_006373, partial [Rhizopus azygosporus]
NNGSDDDYHLGVDNSSQLEPSSPSPEAGIQLKERIRVDFVLFVNDQEVGCGEIKSPGTTSQLLEEDWARTAETLKRQLPVCIMKSKDTKEFKVLE